MIRLAAGVAAAVALLAGGAASAQGNMTSSTTTTTTTTTSAPAGAFTLDTPIETIVANPAGKAVLDKDFPGMTTHPMYESFKSMSLKEVQPMSQGAITDDGLKKASADLAALPK